VNRLVTLVPFATGVVGLSTIVIVATASSSRGIAPAIEPDTMEVAPPRIVSFESIPLAVSPSRRCTDLDLDGDGTADRFEEVPDSCGTGGCVFDVYLGDTPVGQVAGHCPFELDAARPVHDILATWHLGANEAVVTRYRFARGRYREHGEVHCTGDACTAEHRVRR